MLVVCVSRRREVADPEPVSVSENDQDTFNLVATHKSTSISVILMADTCILDLDYFHHG